LQGPGDGTAQPESFLNPYIHPLAAQAEPFLETADGQLQAAQGEFVHGEPDGLPWKTRRVSLGAALCSHAPQTMFVSKNQ
jgi:hypothetical protein